MKKVSYTLLTLLLLSSSFVYAIPSNLKNLIHTTVNDEPLNIRSLPTTKSEKVGKLYKGDEVVIAGFSDHKETIDGYNGYWVKIATYDKEYEFWDFNQKWVFSKYVDIDQSLEVSTIKPVTFLNTPNNPQLDIEVIRQDKTVHTTVSLNHIEGQDFYTFNWMYDYFNKDNFASNDPTGTFVYYPTTNEIKHITVLGETTESAWGLFSNDFHYFFQDFGTSPGVRALAITDLWTNKKIFSGHHLNNLEYDGESIIIVEGNYDHIESITDEERSKATERKKKFTREELKGHDIVDRYRLNLTTGDITYVDSVLVVIQ